MSIGFSVFNLIPVYPLDGFRAVDCFARKRGKVYRFLREKGYYVLLVLLLLGVFADAINVPQLDVLGYALNYVSSLLQYPISAFWGLVFYG
jgi:Zn-dependent protease